MQQHRLLKRQLARYIPNVPLGGLNDFVEAVNQAYLQSDEDREMLERSVELSSRELFAANSQMRAVFEALPDLILHLDISGKILKVAGGEHWEFNVASHDMLGTYIQDAPDREMARLFTDAIRKVNQEKTIDIIEYTALVEGKESHYEARMIPVLETLTVVVIRNTTEQKIYEQKLRDAHQQTETLLTSISSVLIGVDADDCITRWNSASEYTFGIQGHAVLGKEITESGIKWDWEEVKEQITTAREKSRPTRLEEIKYVRPDGKEGFLAITVNPLPRESKNTRHGYVLLATEITERRIMEGQLAQAQKLESIGQLAAGVAHEINTPVQYVGDNMRFVMSTMNDVLDSLEKAKALLELNKKHQFDDDLMQELDALLQSSKFRFEMEEMPDAIEESLNGIERIAVIVRAMKEFSHPGSREKKPVDINRAITNTVTVTQNEWKYVAEIVKDLQPNLPLVPCLPAELNQVLLNMIVNAAHAIGATVASGQKGRITLATAQKDDWVEICVSDTGCGIPPKIQNRIFDPFFTTKEVGKGTGQGLAIAHDVIVKKHQGTITLQSEPGKGTTFFIRLPLTTKMVSAEETPSSEKMATASN